MPEMVLQRNHVVRSLNGSSAAFKAGVPTFVPPQLVPEAVAVGAVFVDGQTPNVLPPEEVAPVAPVSPEARKEAYEKAFVVLVKRNERFDFTGTGIPTAKAVEKLISWEPNPKELKQYWAAWREAQVLHAEMNK